VVYFASIVIEGELNPVWVQDQLLSAAEKELKKFEPGYPFKPTAEESWSKTIEEGDKSGAKAAGGLNDAKAAPVEKP
jgi:hypothetical protein